LQIGQANFAEKRCSLSASVHLDGDRAAVAVAKRGLVRLGEPLLQVGAHAQAVDDDLDRVLRVLREPRHGVDLVHGAVDANATKPFARSSTKRSSCSPLRLTTTGARIMSFVSSGNASVASTICEIVIAASFCSGWSGQYGSPDARVEKAQVVVNFRNRPHRRARVVRRRLLLDRDRGRQAFDQVDVRLFHELQELPRVRRQRFDVAALAFRVERVERERALAGARKAGNDDQPVARQIEIDVLEIVRPRAADANVFHTMDLGRPAHAGQRATVYNTVIPQRFLSRATVGLKCHRLISRRFTSARLARFSFVVFRPTLARPLAEADLPSPPMSHDRAPPVASNAKVSAVDSVVTSVVTKMTAAERRATAGPREHLRLAHAGHVHHPARCSRSMRRRSLADAITRCRHRARSVRLTQGAAPDTVRLGVGPLGKEAGDRRGASHLRASAVSSPHGRRRSAGRSTARIIQGAGAISAAVIALAADLTRDAVRSRAMAAIGMTIGATFALSLIGAPALTPLIGVPGSSC
jgi:hypothetical protein